MTEFNLAVADKHQLKFYAKETLGLALSMNMNESTMRELIQKHCDEKDIEPPVAELGSTPANEGEKRVTINIAKQDKPGGSDPVFVGVQGVGVTIPRGINIKVPARYAHALENAVQDIVTQDPETGEIVKEHVLTYPFQKVA